MNLGLVALPTFGFASALPRALDIVGELVLVVVGLLQYPAE